MRTYWWAMMFRLGSNEFHDVIYPEGYKLIKEFNLTRFQHTTMTLGNVQVKKTIFLPKNKKIAAAVIYNLTNKNNSDAKLRLYPLLTCRYYHTVIDRRRTPKFHPRKPEPQFRNQLFSVPKPQLFAE